MTTDNGFGPDETALEAVGLPAIPISAGALIFDRAGRLLILKPTYKSGWTIPGGVMEADGETPWDACRREVAEECGLHIGAGHPARLACMDFRRPRPGKPGGIRYLFDCDAFSDASLAGIVVQPRGDRRASACRPAHGPDDAEKAHPAAGAGGDPRARALLSRGRPARAGRWHCRDATPATV